MRENEAMAVLASARSVSYGRREHALAAAGCALNLLADPAAYLQALGGEGVRSLREALRSSERMLDRLREEGVHLITQDMPQYPERLRRIAKPPHLLFCLGNAELNDPVQISIVGTRQLDGYGYRHTRRIARELAEKGVCVVSGLALGADAAAHWGALDAGGRTVAVLGGALDKLYPAENRPLMNRIVESGGSVVTEYPPGMAPARYSFLQRNRIVAGMGLGVLVTQAPEKSGALSTAQYALDEGREVFAMPGDIDRINSQLPNKLIAEGARPVMCAADVLGLLVIEPGRERPAGRRAAPQQITMKENAPVRSLDPQEQAVYDQLLAGDLDFDALSEKTGIAGEELGSVLMMMELDGIVLSLPGLRYRLA